MMTHLQRLSLGVLAGTWLSCAAAAGQAWDQEPASYRGVPFGASLKDAKKQARLRTDRCWWFKDGAFFKGETVCNSDGMIGDVEVRETWEFPAGKLASVSFLFDPEHYARLREIFIEKYGKPQSVSPHRRPTPTEAQAREEAETRVLARSRSPWRRTSWRLPSVTAAQAKNESQNWNGVKVSVRLFPYVTELGEGLASFDTHAREDAAAKKAQEEEKRKKAKGAF